LWNRSTVRHHGDEGLDFLRYICSGSYELVMLCYGVLKNRAAFDPDWASKKAA